MTNEVSISPTAPPAYWSYTTCGYRDLFSLNNITDSIRGQTLRVLFIGNTGGEADAMASIESLERGCAHSPDMTPQSNP